MSLVNASRSVNRTITRRLFVELSIAGFALFRCASSPPLPAIPQRFVRLRSRPSKTTVEASPTSSPQKLGLSTERDGFFYFPKSAAGHTPLPLILMLHGAGGSGFTAISRFVPHADRVGALLLAPDSRAETWDIVTRKFGRDAPFIDRALDQIFDKYSIDPRRVAVSGFSDGATYALTLGLTNGDLFSAIAAFSPGFLVVGSEVSGTPRIFISHGTKDHILPVDRCGRQIAQRLRSARYRVDYREFDGAHTLPPPDILMTAVEQLVT